MSALAMYAKIELLPEHLQQQVLDYIEFLLSREGRDKQAETSTTSDNSNISKEPHLPNNKKPLNTLKNSPSAAKKPLKAGFLKGSFVMAADFDEPLEDFKEYMQ